MSAIVSAIVSAIASASVGAIEAASMPTLGSDYCQDQREGALRAQAKFHSVTSRPILTSYLQVHLGHQEALDLRAPLEHQEALDLQAHRVAQAPAEVVEPVEQALALAAGLA